MAGGCAVEGKAGLRTALTRMLPKETLLQGRLFSRSRPSVIESTLLITGRTGARNCETDIFQTRFKVDSPQQFVFLQPLAARGSEWPVNLLSRRN